jgi:peptidoglycan hydrolase CwlO-like protein
MPPNRELRLRVGELQAENERLQGVIRERAELAVGADLKLRQADAKYNLLVAQTAASFNKLAKRGLDLENNYNDLKRIRDDLENDKKNIECIRDGLESEKKSLELIRDDLEQDKMALERTLANLKNDKRNLERTRDALEMHKMNLERSHDDLLRERQRLLDTIDEKDKQIKHIEGQAANFRDDLAAEKEKVRGLNELIKKNKEAEDRTEKYIATIEDHAKRFEDQVKELERDKTDLNNQLAYEKTGRRDEEIAKGVLSTKYDKLLSETNRVRGQLDATQKENASLKEHIEQQKTEIAALEEIHAEALEDRKLAQGLRLQWELVRDELPLFNPSPQAALAPPPPGPNGQVDQPKTQFLASELPLDFGNGSNGLNGESDAPMTTPSNGDPSDAPSDEFSSSSEGEDGDDDDDTEVVDETREVIKTVYVPSPPSRNYPPYQKTAHNPLLCWILVEINTGILFRNWLSYSACRDAPLFRRETQTVGKVAEPVQPVNRNAPESSSSPNGTSDTLSGTSPAVDPQLEKIKELIEPAVSGEDIRAICTPGENLSRDEHFHREPSNAIINPSNSPPVLATLFAFILHLIFYYFLYVCYENYCEQNKWISANETARKLVFDILALRGGDGRGLASHFLSEQVVRAIDRFVLTTFSLFKVEIKPWPIAG